MKGLFKITSGWSWYWIEEWSQFFSACNWYTFHPIMIELEDDRSLGGLEAIVIVLGVGFRVRYTYDDAKLKELEADAAAFIKKWEE